MQHARDRIRQITDRSRLLMAPEWLVEDLNRFLGGWAAFFRYGNSAARFDKISEYARMRLERFISKRHRRNLAFGRWVVAFASPQPARPDHLVGNRRRPPGPSGTGGGKPNAAVNGVGEPCAGEPHARFEAAGAWKRSDLAMITAVKRPAGESRGKVAAGPNARQRHRASPRPYHRYFGPGDTLKCRQAICL